MLTVCTLSPSSEEAAELKCSILRSVSEIKDTSALLEMLNWKQRVIMELIELILILGHAFPLD